MQVLDDRTGGHQGAIVDLPDGNWFGFAMRDSGPIGRVTNISPITWKDNWPLWGEPDNPGHIPTKARKPIDGQPAVTWPASTDFNSTQLPLEWEWNHNPDNQLWSLTDARAFCASGRRPPQTFGPHETH